MGIFWFLKSAIAAEIAFELTVIEHFSRWMCRYWRCTQNAGLLITWGIPLTPIKFFIENNFIKKHNLLQFFAYLNLFFNIHKNIDWFIKTLFSHHNQKQKSFYCRQLLQNKRLKNNVFVGNCKVLRTIELAQHKLANKTEKNNQNVIIHRC